MTLEEAQEQLLALKEQQDQLAEDNKTLKEQLESKTKREQELVEHNQKLFMRITNKVEDKTEETDAEKEMKEYLVSDKLLASLSDKDKRILKQIMEGEDE